MGDVGGQTGAGHRVPVVGGELDQGGRHLVQLDQTFLVKQLHGLLLGRLLEGGNVSRNLRELLREKCGKINFLLIILDWLLSDAIN